MLEPRKRRWSDLTSSSAHRQISLNTNDYSDDDEDKKHFIVHTGHRLHVVKREIGEGTFGKVYKCLDEKYNDIVAIKVVRGISRYVDSAKIEAKILDNIFQKQKHHRTNCCVNQYSHFPYEGYYCIVTERLGISLYEFIKMNDHRGFPLRCVQHFASQLLDALDFLKSINLIHTDLKVENILLVDDTYTIDDNGWRIPNNTLIKIIDFGGATYDDEHKTTIINTRQYRGPEVTLEVGWSFPSDMWSAACILAEVYSGELFFATHSNCEHLALMEMALGPFPRWMIDKCRKREKYFNRYDEVKWRDQVDHESRKHIRAMPTIREYFLRYEHRGERVIESGLKELIQEMLVIDPYQRIKPHQALRLPFFKYSTSSSVDERKEPSAARNAPSMP